MNLNTSTNKHGVINSYKITQNIYLCKHEYTHTMSFLKLSKKIQLYNSKIIMLD
jgi:hypothetical protein